MTRHAVAAFDGVCPRCGTPYRHGDPVNVAADARLCHVVCPPMTPPPRPDPAAVAPPAWVAPLAQKGRDLAGTYARGDDDATRADLKAWARTHPDAW